MLSLAKVMVSLTRLEGVIEVSLGWEEGLLVPVELVIDSVCLGLLLMMGLSSVLGEVVDIVEGVGRPVLGFNFNLIFLLLFLLLLSRCGLLILCEFTLFLILKPIASLHLDIFTALTHSTSVLLYLSSISSLIRLLYKVNPCLQQ